MKLIIDITEQDFHRVCQEYIDYSNTLDGRCLAAISEGVLIPDNATNEDVIKAIRALKQEPANTKLMLMEANINGYDQGLKDSSKTGHWLNKEFRKAEYVLVGKCSVCGRVRAIDEHCPNCGARMVEPQESEDKE